MSSILKLALINDLKLAENAAMSSENVVSEPFRQCLMHGFNLTLTSLISKQLIYLVKFSQYLVLHKIKKKIIADITTKDSVYTNEEANHTKLRLNDSILSAATVAKRKEAISPTLSYYNRMQRAYQ